ncbi:hypothetical protein AB0G00_23880 [Nocardia salmonicida]|uniref:hypothetical protein n=1 Tax=Nocardia salmonicida TaxID=53431 RepID=UPI003408344C
MDLLISAAERQLQAAEEDLNHAATARRALGWVTVGGFVSGFAGIPAMLAVAPGFASLIVAGLCVGCFGWIAYTLKDQDVNTHLGRTVVGLDKLNAAQRMASEREYLNRGFA